ncbi:MAG: hypothetical protein ACLGHG_08220 [Gammaproteobacteria bacterium]
MPDLTRRDVRVGDLSEINAADANASPRATAGAKVPSAPAAGRVPVPGVPSTAGAGRGLDYKAILIALLVVVLMLAVVYLYRQQQQLAGALAAVEEQQRASVRLLETQVVSTASTLESTLKSSDSETQKSLNLLAADLRRINDVLGKQSRQVDAQGKDLGRRVEELGALTEEVKRLGQASTQAATQLDTRLKTLAENLEQQSGRQKSLADAVTRLERSGDASQLRSELAVLSASLREGQQEHDRRIKATEQAIASNDAFRRQVNATIDRLTQQVSELYPKR